MMGIRFVKHSLPKVPRLLIFAPCASPKTLDDMRQRKGLMKPQRSSADFKRRRKNFMRLELRFTPKPEWSNISHLVSTITEIQEAIEKLPASDKSALAAWLQSKEEPIM